MGGCVSSAAGVVVGVVVGAGKEGVSERLPRRHPLRGLVAEQPLQQVDEVPGRVVHVLHHQVLPRGERAEAQGVSN